MPLPLNTTSWVSLIRMSSAIPLSGSSTLTIWITERDDSALWSVNLCVVWPLCKWYIPNVGRYLLYCEQLLYCAAREQARHCVTAIIIHCHWQGYIFCRKRSMIFWGEFFHVKKGIEDKRTENISLNILVSRSDVFIRIEPGLYHNKAWD